MTWREDLRAILGEVPADELPNVIGELARAQAVAQLRLSAPRSRGKAPTPPAPDRQLTATEAAERLRMSAKWVRRYGDQLGASHLSPRAVRYSERAIQRYLEAKRSTP